MFVLFLFVLLCFIALISVVCILISSNINGRNDYNEFSFDEVYKYMKKMNYFKFMEFIFNTYIFILSFIVFLISFCLVMLVDEALFDPTIMEFVSDGFVGLLLIIIIYGIPALFISGVLLMILFAILTLIISFHTCLLYYIIENYFNDDK